MQYLTSPSFAACEGYGICYRCYPYCNPVGCNPLEDTLPCVCGCTEDNYNVSCDATCTANACASGGTGPADFCSLVDDAPYSDAPYDSPYDYPYDSPYDYPYDSPYSDSPYDSPYDNPYDGTYTITDGSYSDSPYDSPYDNPYDGTYDNPYDGTYAITDGSYSDSPYDSPYDNPYDGTYGCSGNSGPFCGANFTITGVDINGTQKTINSVTYNSTNGGNNIGNNNSITIQPGDVLQFNAKPSSALQSDNCVISYNGRYDVVRKNPGPATTINRCFEGLLFGEALFCENGQGKIGYRLAPINSNFDPEGVASIPPLQIKRTVRGCGFHHFDYNPDDTISSTNWKCSECMDNGFVGDAGGGEGVDGNFERNSGYDSSGNIQYTPEYWGGTNRFAHGNTTPNPDEELNSVDDACLIKPDNFPNSIQATGLSPEAAARDNMTKKQFDTPGEYRVEYRTARSGINGGAMDSNPCVMKVVVQNPEPPAGTISANPATCIIQDGDFTCSSTISWNTSDADTIRVEIDSTDFSPASSNTSGSSVAPWINENPSVFELYGSSYSFPEALLGTVTVRGNPYISGDVFIDLNENGFIDTGEVTYTGGGNVLVNGSATPLDSNGHYARTNLAPSSYDVSYTAPAGYQLTTPSLRSISLTQPTTVNFGISPLHTVSGRIFNDRNKNKIFDGGDSIYTSGSLEISGTTTSGTVTTNSINGSYTLSNIPSGVRTISLTSPLPAGYRVIWPRGTTPPAYSVQVGPICTSGPLDTTTGASYIDTTVCDIQDLDFAISDSIPWIQMVGSDGRFDGGLNNTVSNASACNGGYTLVPGNNSNPGVLLIGTSTPSSAFGGVGAASSTNWVLGTPFPEYFTFFSGNQNTVTAGLQTSYDYLLGAAETSNITPTDLTTVCSDLSNCTLNNPANGIYRANGNVTLTGNSTLGANKDHIFLINGDLTINGQITTPVSSTSTFSVKGDITVTKDVGTSAFSCPAPSTSGQMQGFFSADESIIIDAKDPTGAGANCSNGNGDDLQLNVDGALVVNAGLSGGSFINRRDLCAFNITYPSLSVKERLDFVLNAPELLKTNTYIYREVAP